MTPDDGFTLDSGSESDSEGTYVIDWEQDEIAPGAAAPKPPSLYGQDVAVGDFVLELARGRSMTIGASKGKMSELGLKLWKAATMLNYHMAHDGVGAIVGKDVLELGAGVGASGFMAAALGARRVVIGDCGPDTMLSLAKSLSTYQNGGGKTVTTMWNSFNADHNETILLRRHLWEEDLEIQQAGQEHRKVDRIRHWSKLGDDDNVGMSSDTIAPTLDAGEQFDTIIAADILYFGNQEKPLLAVFQRRLRPGGVIILLQTLRTVNIMIFDRLVEAAKLSGFEVTATEPSDEMFAACDPRSNETPHTVGYRLVILRFK
jgi:predicted nicotinamide N-methyase